MTGNGRWLGGFESLLFTVFVGLMANWISNGFRFPGSASVVFAIIGVASGLVLLVRELPVLFHRSPSVVNGWSTSRRSALICTISDRPGASDELVPVIVEQLKKKGRITCLGLIGTAETEMGGTARTITERLGDLQGLLVKEVPCDPFDLKDAHVMAQSLINWAITSCRVPHRQVLIDVTGGTAVMTLGAYLAAQEAGIDVEYVATPRTAGQKADMRGRHPVIISRGRRGTVHSLQGIAGEGE